MGKETKQCLFILQYVEWMDNSYDA